MQMQLPPKNVPITPSDRGNTDYDYIGETALPYLSTLGRLRRGWRWVRRATTGRRVARRVYKDVHD